MFSLTRRGIIITIIIVWIIVILLILASVNIGSHLGKDIKFQVIVEWNMLDIVNESYRVIDNEEEFKSLWIENCHIYRSHPDNSSMSEQIPPPNVDFNKSFIIAAFWGVKSHGGYLCQVSKITEFDDKIVVYVTNTYSNYFSAHTLAFEYPQSIVKIDKTDKLIEFEIEERYTLLGIKIIDWGIILGTIFNIGLIYKYYIKHIKIKASIITKLEEKPLSEQKEVKK